MGGGEGLSKANDLTALQRQTGGRRCLGTHSGTGTGNALREVWMGPPAQRPQRTRSECGHLRHTHVPANPPPGNRSAGYCDPNRLSG